VSEILTRDPAVLSADSRLSTLPPNHHQGFLDGFAAFLRDVYGAVCGALPHRYPTFEEGLRSAQITEAVLRSSEQRSWVTVPG
jgi:predicted dehydrogenase